MTPNRLLKQLLNVKGATVDGVDFGAHNQAGEVHTALIAARNIDAVVLPIDGAKF